jgi:hypothetical protein
LDVSCRYPGKSFFGERLLLNRKLIWIEGAATANAK